MFRISHSRFARASVIALVAAPLSLFAPRSALAVDVNADCAAMYGSSFSPVIGQVAAPAPGGARPAKGVPFKDPAFGTCVVRATNHAVEPPSGFARNDYSRRQAFNVDNSRMLVRSEEHTSEPQSLMRISY